MGTNKFIYLSLLVVVGCGGGGGHGGGAPGGSGVDGSKVVSTLTDQEKAQFCDWMAGVVGGYGVRVTCDGGGNIGFPQDQPTCVAHAFKTTCVQTVSQLEACIEKVGTNLCIEVEQLPTECVVVADCLG
jgi:hypothetical protein